MRRQLVVGFLVLALSAAAVASAGAVGQADGRSCTTQRFGAMIQSLGADGVALKIQGRDRAVTFRLLARTQIRKQDRVVGVTALVVGQRVIAEVRTCQGGRGPTEVALVSLTLVATAGAPTGDGPPAPPSPAPSTPSAVCARGDFTAPVSAVGADSVSFASSGAEGARTFSVGVTAETAIVKNGSAAKLGDLKPGDKLHVWVVLCLGAPPTLKATRIEDLTASTTTVPPPTTTPPPTE